MRTFLCKSCNQKFEAKGTKVDWNDPIYGPCSKYTAPCPFNGEECDEFRPIKNNKEEFASSGSSCGNGNCCCGR